MRPPNSNGPDTDGFTSAFRLVSPTREPVYSATANTLPGSLSELERQLGKVACGNGRGAAPSVDSRYTVTAYFHIFDIASMVDIDRETVNLAVRLYKTTAAAIPMRSKQVESFATACLYVALSLRHAHHAAWAESQPQNEAAAAAEAATDADGDYEINGVVSSGASAQPFDPSSVPPTPEAVTLEDFSEIGGVTLRDLDQHIELVRTLYDLGPEAVQGHSGRESVEAPLEIVVPVHVPETSPAPVLSKACAASFAKVPDFAATLGLQEQGTALAVSIVRKSFHVDACPRRAPASISAACIYLTCQMMKLKWTQAEVCNVMQVTEVTLRKVYKELLDTAASVVPEEYLAEIPSSAGNRRARPKSSSTVFHRPDRDRSVDLYVQDSPLSISPERGSEPVQTGGKHNLERVVGSKGVVGEVGQSIALDVRAGGEVRKDPAVSSAEEAKKGQREQLLAMMEQNPAAVAAFAKALALVPGLAGSAQAPENGSASEGVGAVLPESGSAAISAVDDGVDAQTVDKVRQIMAGITDSQPDTANVAHPPICPPPPPPPLPPLPPSEPVVPLSEPPLPTLPTLPPRVPPLPPSSDGTRSSSSDGGVR